MRQNNVSSSAPKHSTGAAQTSDKQITAKKDFASKICKVKNYAYLCFAKEPDFGHNKVIRTLFERVPVALLHPQSWFFGENKRDTLSFCIY